VSLLGPVLNAVGDKMVPVKEAAQSAAAAIVQAVNGNAVKAVVTPILSRTPRSGPKRWPLSSAWMPLLRLPPLSSPSRSPA
jgi:elongation factor 3